MKKPKKIMIGDTEVDWYIPFTGIWSALKWLKNKILGRKGE